MRSTLLALALLSVISACAVPRWPVDGTVTSPFGVRRSGLLLDLHRGIDIAVPEGTPVRSMTSGRVAFAGTMRGYGYVVMVDHGPRLRTVYAHLAEIHVERGDEIDGHAVLGLAGATGRASAAHLHFEVLRRGAAEDPVPLLGDFPRPPGS